MPKEVKKTAPVTEEEEFTVDMTTAKTFEPLPINKPYLTSISKFKTGKTANGRKVDYEVTVAEPTEYAGRKVQESTSLDNEYGLGRVKQLLIAAGMPKEEVDVKGFKIPIEDDVLGMQLTIWVRIRQSEQYGDRNNITRMRPASAYAEVVAST